MNKPIITAIILMFGFAAVARATIINVPGDYSTIQGGINGSYDGDTVLVQPGTYVENVNFNGHNIVLGSLFLTTGDTSFIAETVIDGDDIAPAVDLIDIESPGPQISGFKIQNGRNLGGIHCENSFLSILFCLIIDNSSGGVFCENSSLILYSCTIVDNTSFFKGGGIRLINSDASIERCNIISNTVRTYGYEGPSIGGGIYCSNSNVVMTYNNISDNFAWGVPMFHVSGEGAGIYCDSSLNVVVCYNSIKDNISTENGSGIFCSNSNIFIQNNIVMGNYSYYGYYGDGIDCYNSDAIIINNIIMANEGMIAGGGIHCNYGILINNIIRENSPDQISGSNPAVFYCNVQGGWEGEGNIDVDPLFRDPENDDFHLMSTECSNSYDSPCIDTGYPEVDDILLDCAWGLGELRSDMGAYGGGDSVVVGIDEYIAELPESYSLLQNYPNPFNLSTTIRYSLPGQSDVRIEIYNILGEKVAMLFDGSREAGSYTATWHADNYPSGVYFARLQAGGRSENVKMVLLK